MADKSEQRRINRTLTQKYDMGALRALQKLESELLVEMAPIYGCDEDEVPVELDLLAVYNMEESKRLPELKALFAGAPGDVSAILEKLAGELINVSNMPGAKQTVH